VQYALSALNYNPEKIDGWMGDKTRKAVALFQKANDLKDD